MSKGFIARHQELYVYQVAFETAMRMFEIVQSFPEVERHLLREQVVRSSRSVCANIAEAWQKRRYKNAFIAKLNEAESEAAETQTWIEFSIICGYLDAQTGQELFQKYTDILTDLDRLIEHASAWEK